MRMTGFGEWTSQRVCWHPLQHRSSVNGPGELHTLRTGTIKRF